MPTSAANCTQKHNFPSVFEQYLLLINLEMGQIAAASDGRFLMLSVAAIH